MKRQNAIIDPLKKDFISLLTDFGFKRVLGSKEHSTILLRFLNALFEGRMTVTNVEFRDKELLPMHSTGKKVQYDIYCTTDADTHFIIEMQQEESENFSDRILFYVCKAIVNQGIKGVEYELDPVYCVIITNFNMSGKERRLLKEMILMERSSGEIYTENMKLIFLALPEVSADWDNCKSELERLLFLIKNMENLTKDSKPYKSGEYDDVFTASSTEYLSNEEAVAYSKSYFKELDNQSAVRFAARKNREEGREEGRMLQLADNVRNLRRNGFDDPTIARLLNLPLKMIGTII